MFTLAERLVRAVLQNVLISDAIDQKVRQKCVKSTLKTAQTQCKGSVNSVDLSHLAITINTEITRVYEHPALIFPS